MASRVKSKLSILTKKEGNRIDGRTELRSMPILLRIMPIFEAEGWYRDCIDLQVQSAADRREELL